MAPAGPKELPYLGMDPQVEVKAPRGYSLTDDAHAPEAARRIVRRAISDAGWQGDVEVVMLLTSEIVTNAVRHGGHSLELRVIIDNGRLRVETTDDNVLGRPIRKNPPPWSESGRGLVVVDAMASQWGTDQVGDGKKIVWFELAPS
ncbi:MAG: ATP-binding protein [Acidimicrobiales bacterium]